MFGIDSAELLIIALVALVVIGPKDLPRAMRTIGNFVGRARGMARHFRSGFDAMIREVELEDMEKQWAANNDRIMRETPVVGTESNWGQPAAEAAQPALPAETKPVPPSRRAATRQAARKAPPIPPVTPALPSDDQS